MVTEFVVIFIEVVVLVVLYHHMRSLKEHTIILEEHIFHMEKSLDDLDRKLKGHYEAVTGMFDEIDIDRVMEKAHERTGKGK